MFHQKKIILVIDSQVGDHQIEMGRRSLVNEGYETEIFRLSGYFTEDSASDFYRFAAECRVSPQQLDSEFNKARSDKMTYGIPGTDLRDITFEEYCWKYVSIVLMRAIGTLKDIGCVIGTNRAAVNYLVDHLLLEANVTGIVVPKQCEVQSNLDLTKTTYM
jgi:hypothetical protein